MAQGLAASGYPEGIPLAFSPTHVGELACAVGYCLVTIIRCSVTSNGVAGSDTKFATPRSVLSSLALMPYQGINVLLLWGEVIDQGYVGDIWMTYQQATELGGRVRKGEHGTLAVYADRYTKNETGENGDEGEREIPFMKALHRVQRRADRRFAREIPSEAGT